MDIQNQLMHMKQYLDRNQMTIDINNLLYYVEHEYDGNHTQSTVEVPKLTPETTASVDTIKPTGAIDKDKDEDKDNYKYMIYIALSVKLYWLY